MSLNWNMRAALRSINLKVFEFRMTTNANSRHTTLQELTSLRGSRVGHRKRRSLPAVVRTLSVSTHCPYAFASERSPRRFKSESILLVSVLGWLYHNNHDTQAAVTHIRVRSGRVRHRSRSVRSKSIELTLAVSSIGVRSCL